MKFDFPPRAAKRDAAIRPGFDVLMAVTSARQAASPTARLVAARRGRGEGKSNETGCAALLAHGRITGEVAGKAVRFAELAVGTVPEQDSDAAAKEEMKTPFTKAFQPMVKHVDLDGPLNAERPVGNGPGME